MPPLSCAPVPESHRSHAQTLTTNLDHLRWMAAMMVVVQHCRGFVIKDYSPSAHGFAKLMYALTGFSHQAVVIFFVISGYLVGGKAVRLWREGRATDVAAKKFVIDRFSRIFVVLWPALLVTAFAALVAPEARILHDSHWTVGVGDVRGSATPVGWAAPFVLLNELVVPTLEWDGPLWSLAFEWTYYMLAAAALLAVARRRSPFAVAVGAYVVGLILLSTIDRPLLLTMFPFWVAGAAASQVQRLRLPWVTIPLFFIALLASRISVMPWLQDAFVAFATALLVADNWFREKQPAPRLGYELAAFSFSLYAIHLPIMLLGLAVIQHAGFLQTRMDPGLAAYGLVLGLCALAYAAAWTFAQATERQTDRLRRTLSKRLMGAPPRRPAPPEEEPVSAELENVARL